MNFQSTIPNSDETESSAKRQWLLFQGIKSLLRSDEAETVQGIARYVISQYRSLRIGSEFVERKRNTTIPSVAAFLGAATRFLEIRESERQDGVVWVARLDNERHAIEKLPPLLPELDWTELTFHRRPDHTTILALPRKLFPLRRRISRLVRLLLRYKHEFFKVLRVVELIGYYTRYLDIFQKGNFSLAIMSSHSNPHGIAFNLAARRCGVPTVLITHGMPVRPVAKLSYDLAIVHCEAARRIYLKDGCRIKQAIIHGRRQDYMPMPETQPCENLTVGVFLCKDVNEKRLRELTERLSGDEKVSRIIIRPHPKNLFVEFEEWLASINDSSVIKSDGASVYQDLEKSDVVFGGNSSVLIEAVTGGKPACYVENLDYGAADLHQFVAQKLIYPCDAELNFDFDAMLCFYQRSDWSDILRNFANLDEDAASVANRISSAIRQLIAPHDSPKK